MCRACPQCGLLWGKELREPFDPSSKDKKQKMCRVCPTCCPNRGEAALLVSIYSAAGPKMSHIHPKPQTGWGSSRKSPNLDFAKNLICKGGGVYSFILLQQHFFLVIFNPFGSIFQIFQSSFQAVCKGGTPNFATFSAKANWGVWGSSCYEILQRGWYLSLSWSK